MEVIYILSWWIKSINWNSFVPLILLVSNSSFNFYFYFKNTVLTSCVCCYGIILMYLPKVFFCTFSNLSFEDFIFVYNTFCILSLSPLSLFPCYIYAGFWENVFYWPVNFQVGKAGQSERPRVQHSRSQTSTTSSFILGFYVTPL